MPGAGLEPARPKGHMALNHACLPISAPGQILNSNLQIPNSKRQLRALEFGAWILEFH